MLFLDVALCLLFSLASLSLHWEGGIGYVVDVVVVVLSFCCFFIWNIENEYCLNLDSTIIYGANVYFDFMRPRFDNLD